MSTPAAPYPTDPQALFNRRQAAAFLGVSLRKIGNILASGDLPRVRLGRSVRIARLALEEFIEANTARRAA